LTNTQFQADSLARPLRVAYLIELENSPPELLDAIFAECYGRWGGRWTLIIPCENGKPYPDYIKWLEKWDPDLIYSYPELSIENQAVLHEQFYPSSLIIHKMYDEREARKWRPDIKCSAVSSFSVLPWIAARPNIFSPEPAFLLDAYWSEPMQPRWIRDSFGLPRESVGATALVEAASSVIPTFSLISENKLDDQSLGKSLSAKYVVGEREWLLGYAENRSSVSLADAASFISQRIDLPYQRKWQGLNLVVGDSNSDRIMFWNCFHHNNIHSTGLYALRVDSDSFEDDKKFEILAALVRNRNQHYEHGSGVTVIRSCSIDDTKLSAFADKLRTELKHHYVSHEAMTSIEGSVPNLQETAWGSEHRHVWTQRIEKPAANTSFSGDQVRCVKALPPQFDEISHVPRLLRGGAWMLDITLERAVNHSRFSNVSHWWRLPRRLRLAFQFIARGSVSGGDEFLWLLPRVSRKGELSIATSLAANDPQLTMQDDDRLLRGALFRPNDWIRFNGQEDDVKNSAIWQGYAHAEPSDKGQYLIGALNLMGGLANCIEILTDPFWINLFGKLGADTKLKRDAVIDGLIGTLKKKEQWKAFPINIADDQELRALLEKSWVEVRKADHDGQSLAFGAIQDMWKIAQFDQENLAPKSHLSEFELEQWNEMDRRSFVDTLGSLSEQQVLHQGQEWQCSKCLNRNWIAISNLSRTWRCEVCDHHRPADVTSDWRFRLNGFLKRALTDHGLLPTIWCLNELRNRARDSFYYLPSEILFSEYPWPKRVPPSAELDLLAIVDGQTYLCEIKSSSRITPQELKTFASLATVIRPDKALLAIYGCDAAKRDKLQSDLSALLPQGVLAEVISRNLH
jgi:hypothetical protein